MTATLKSKFGGCLLQRSIKTAAMGRTILGRGAVLGALPGAALGVEKLLARWVKNLLEPLPDLSAD